MDNDIIENKPKEPLGYLEQKALKELGQISELIYKREMWVVALRHSTFADELRFEIGFVPLDGEEQE